MARPRSRASDSLKGLSGQAFQPSTTGDTHPQDFKTGGLTITQDGRQLFKQQGIVLQFGTGDKRDMACQPVLMQVGQGKTGAVRGQQ